MQTTNDVTKTPAQRIMDRHIARMLDELEAAGCPIVCRGIARQCMRWARTDMMRLEESMIAGASAGQGVRLGGQGVCGQGDKGENAMTGGIRAARKAVERVIGWRAGKK